MQIRIFPLIDQWTLDKHIQIRTLFQTHIVLGQYCMKWEIKQLLNSVAPYFFTKLIYV
jgi:hypothetical protein